MRYAVVWDSRGGNTRMLGEALLCDLAGAEGTELVHAGPLAARDGSAAVADASLADADAVLVGFWCERGDCTPAAAEFLGRLGGKRVFVFGTAGFGGAPEYFRRILDRVETHLPADAMLVGDAMCQGKMAPGVRRRYESMLEQSPDDARVLAMIENFDEALAHPDGADLAAVVAAARAALGL